MLAEGGTALPNPRRLLSSAVSSIRRFPPHCPPSKNWHGACEITTDTQNVAHESDRLVKLQNRLVNFRVRDVHFPEPEKILHELYGRHVLQGWVTGITRDNEAGEFAIIEIDGVEN